jgi:tRNA (guanosine-2'-O-)-methyltransferase
MDRESEEAIDPVRSFPRRPWAQPWTARGVTELLEPLVNTERRQRLERVLNARIGSVTLLLDSPHDPRNGAAILRTCDAFGLAEMHVLARTEPMLASNVISTGAERWVDVVEHHAPTEALAALSAQGFELVATHPQGELLPEELAELPRVALLLGNEHRGIGEDLMQSAGRSVRIPMVGFVESLNLSVSAAILLRACTRLRSGDLSAEQWQTLYAQGLYRSVRRAADVLQASTPR